MSILYSNLDTTPTWRPCRCHLQSKLLLEFRRVRNTIRKLLRANLSNFHRLQLQLLPADRQRDVKLPFPLACTANLPSHWRGRSAGLGPGLA